ncbi:MAG TPA: hypothetical protein VD969_18365 [Symbiobacteriaceae bacterium]|nr:hypothetical protein [Symbiobacteriaceae bacterium]
MNLATLQFRSVALQRHVTYSAILPEAQAGPAPVLLQLHGYSDDHTAWLNFSNLVRHAREYPFIIVLPDGGASFYLQARPVIPFDCGTEDFPLEQNRRMHAHMEKVGLAHAYLEFPGARTWEYWDEHVQEALRQHAAVLK